MKNSIFQQKKKVNLTKEKTTGNYYKSWFGIKKKNEGDFEIKKRKD